MGFKITTVTCFVSVDPETGDEGTMAIFTPTQGWIPLIAADEARIASMYEAAEDIRIKHGVEYRVIQFSDRQDVTTETHRKYQNPKIDFLKIVK